KYSPKLHTRKAKLLIENHQEELGMESLDRAEIFGQSFVETDLLRARAYAALDNFSTAFSLIDDLKLNYYISSQESSMIALEEALIFEKLNDFDKMFIATRDALNHNPFNEYAL